MDKNSLFYDIGRNKIISKYVIVRLNWLISLLILYCYLIVVVDLSRSSRGGGKAPPGGVTPAPPEKRIVVIRLIYSRDWMQLWQEKWHKI